MRLYSKLRKFLKWIWHWVLLVGRVFYLPYQIVKNSVQPTDFVLFQLILTTFSLRLFHFLHINAKFMLGSLEAECIIFPWLRRSYVGSVLSVVNFTTLLQMKSELKRGYSWAFAKWVRPRCNFCASMACVLLCAFL